MHITKTAYYSVNIQKLLILIKNFDKKDKAIKYKK